jgi:alginate O-acetyltransferase complex protein AlgI
MAIGAALIFGIYLPLNFNSPYKSVNIIEFWRRWHMTLGRFLRDYVYIPLGGNRSGNLSRHRNLFVTMLIGGIWHGAGWNFLIWGALHGSYLVGNHGWVSLKKHFNITTNYPRVWRTLSILFTFILVVIAWVFFRATDFDAAVTMLTGMLHAVILSVISVIAMFYINSENEFLYFQF